MIKQLFHLSLLALAVLISACNSETLSIDDLFSGEAETIEVSALPSEVVAAVTQALPGQNIISASKITASDGTVMYSVETDSTEMTCNGNGRQISAIDPADLPQGAIDYLAANYSASVILRAGELARRDSSVIYVVSLSSGEILAFDEDGNLVAERERGRGRHHGHSPHASFTEIEVADLPQTIADYLTTNNPSDTVEKAFTVTKRDGTTVYGVVLDGHEVLFFDADGNLLENFRPGWHR
ncbi:MAG: PepSY-like domain-containing protein [Bacteroidia bacterium]|nr:PepSY-like domain-containing protein [Bacteroidia bacterium]